MEKLKDINITDDTLAVDPDGQALYVYDVDVIAQDIILMGTLITQNFQKDKHKEE